MPANDGKPAAVSRTCQSAHGQCPPPVPADANQEVCVRLQDVLQAGRLGVEAFARRQIALLEREPAEAVADICADYLQIGEAGRRSRL